MHDKEKLRKIYAQRMQQRKVLDGLKTEPQSYERNIEMEKQNNAHKALVNRVVINSGKRRAKNLTENGNIFQSVVPLIPRSERNDLYFFSPPQKYGGKIFEIELPEYIWSKEKAEVSIIIPLYKSDIVLKDLINSIPDKCKYRIEYIFVDDACPNNSKDLVLELFNQIKDRFNTPIVRIIHLEKNRGYGQACNVGASFATGENLIFLNADTELTDNWVEPMIDLISSDSKIGIVGNMQIRHGTEFIDSAGSEWSWSKSLFLHIGGHSYNKKMLCESIKLKDAPKELLEVAEREMVTGCCFAIAKKLFEYVGGFNPNYRIGYWEDTELCMTVKELGYKILFQPNSKIYHKGGHTKSGGHTYYLNNVSYFMNKWVKSGRINSLLLSEKENNIRTPERILLMRKNSNGDVLIASSVCYALKQKYPRCQITFATVCTDSVIENTYIDKVIHYDKLTQNNNFDVIYNLDDAYEWRPNANIKTVFAEAVGVKPEDCKCGIKLKEPKNINLPKDYIVLHPGETNWAGRNWPRENWYKISERLLSSKENVILVGKHTEKPTPCTINLIDKLNCAELAYVIKNAKLFAGIDSFPFHVAQEQDVPALIFLGSVSPELVVTNSKSKFIRAKNLSCLGCHKNKPLPLSAVHGCEIQTRECETKVTVEEMWNEIQNYLKEIKNGNISILG
jgi:GT2 family glycosyltransferase/ADP-heptose:LPS heptosyltransferase